MPSSAAVRVMLPLLVRTASLPLARVMRSLLTGYAGAFNRRHGRSGHLFQNRYKAIVCEEEPYFLDLVRYLHLNPLRAGLVVDLAALDHYRYSGHAVLMGSLSASWQQTAAVLTRFASSSDTEARTRYRAFVAEGVDHSPREDLTGGVVQTREGWIWAPRLQHGREVVRSDEQVLGQPAFLEALLRQVDDMQASTGRHQTVTLDRLIAVVCPDQQVTREAIRGTGRLPAVCRAREGFAYRWIEYLGRSGRQLAQAVGIRPESIYKAARRGAREPVRWQQLLHHTSQNH